MGESRKIMAEFGKELGFVVENNRVVLFVGNNDIQNMRSDVKMIGRDLRKVMEARS